MNILVSGCLLGECCRYDGKASGNIRKELEEMGATCISICPEQLGGMETPRVPSEIMGNQVLAKDGQETTTFFISGAKKALDIGMENQCHYAVLKEKSPSCGYGLIYDGTFSGNKIKGNGITTQLLLEHGYAIYGESNYKNLAIQKKH